VLYNSQAEPHAKVPVYHIASKMPSIKCSRIEDAHEDGDVNIIGGHASARSRLMEPLVYSGSLDSFKHQDLTPVIGREFEGLQVTDLLRWGDAMIRDLAITGRASISNLTKSMANLSCQSRNAASSFYGTKMSHQIR
jgi:hypothetical protein